MGACYTVSITPRFKDKQAFCDIIREKTADWKLSGTRFPKRSLYTDPEHGKPAAELFDLNDPLECFKLLTAEDVYQQDDSWSADFDASYGWETVLMDVFEKAVTALEEGSEIYVEPDDYWYRIFVRDGKVEIDQSPDDEGDCDDQE